MYDKFFSTEISQCTPHPPRLKNLESTNRAYTPEINGRCSKMHRNVEFLQDVPLGVGWLAGGIYHVQSCRSSMYERILFSSCSGHIDEVVGLVT